MICCYVLLTCTNRFVLSPDPSLDPLQSSQWSHSALGLSHVHSHRPIRWTRWYVTLLCMWVCVWYYSIKMLPPQGILLCVNKGVDFSQGSTIYVYVCSVVHKFLCLLPWSRSCPRNWFSLQPAAVCVRGWRLQDQGLELQAKAMLVHSAGPSWLHQNSLLPQGKANDLVNTKLISIFLTTCTCRNIPGS